MEISVLRWGRRKRHPWAVSPPASRRREKIPTERTGDVRPALGPRAHMRNQVREPRRRERRARGRVRYARNRDAPRAGRRRERNETRWRTTCRMRTEDMHTAPGFTRAQAQSGARTAPAPTGARGRDTRETGSRRAAGCRRREPERNGIGEQRSMPEKRRRTVWAERPGQGCGGRPICLDPPQDIRSAHADHDRT